jgi:carboxylate-amine ligase
LGGKFTGSYDTRLKYYKINQAKIPSITGRVIPEAVFSKRNYLQVIYEKIKADIAQYDPEQKLNPIWVNSRGAIARFDRGSIEIRVMDCQESPAADMAVVTIVVETIKALVAGKFLDHDTQMKWKTDTLAHIFDRVVENAGETVLDQQEYLQIFGVQEKKVTVQELWLHIVSRLSKGEGSELERRKHAINILLKEGTLAQRMVRAMNNNFSQANIAQVYRQLSVCLVQNKLFVPQ